MLDIESVFPAIIFSHSKGGEKTIVIGSDVTRYYRFKCGLPAKLDLVIDSQIILQIFF